MRLLIGVLFFVCASVQGLAEAQSASDAALAPPSEASEPHPATAQPLTSRPPRPFAVGLSATAFQELRALELERESLDLGAPVGLVAAGGTGALLFGYLTMLAATDGDRRRSMATRVPLGPLMSLVAINFVVAMAGVVWLFTRAATRRRLDEQIEEMQLRIAPPGPRSPMAADFGMVPLSRF